jgi:hypothetical protein
VDGDGRIERGPRHAADDPADTGGTLDIHSLRAVTGHARQLAREFDTVAWTTRRQEMAWMLSAAAVLREIAR